NTVETELIRNRIDLAQTQLMTGQQALAQIKRPDLGTTLACMQAEGAVARWAKCRLAVTHIRKAIESAERAGRTQGNMYPKLLSFLGAVQQQRGDLVASYDALKKEQRLAEQLGRTETADYLSGLRTEAVLLMGFGEYVEAQTIIESIVKRWSALTGDDSVPVWLSLSQGVLMQKFGDSEGAQRELTAAATPARAQGSVERALNIELALTRVLLELGRADEAERLLTSIEAAGKPRTVRSSLITTMTVRAELLRAQGELAKATQVIDTQLAAIGFPTAKPSAPLAAALRVAARVELESNDTAGAQERAADALAVSERMARDPAKSADVGEALLLLAQAQRANGQASEGAANPTPGA